MGILSGLSSFGLGDFQNEKIYQDDKEKALAKKQAQGQAGVMEEKDYLFEKTYTCPVCDTKFKVLAVRVGKAKLVSQDDDLRPRYEGIDPLKYDAILCNNCGFAAISRGFVNMTSLQMRNIKTKISANFKPLPESGETYTYDEAIVKHKIALVCSMVKNSKLSERAYTCLKLAWLLRSKMESLDVNSPEYKQAEAEVAECISNAYEGFTQAYSKENFPMCGMERMTVTYLLAELARQVGKYDEATKLLGQIITEQNASTRLKDKAYDLKDRIKLDLIKAAEEDSRKG